MVSPNIYALNAMASGVDTLELIVNNVKLAGVIGLEDDNQCNIANYGSTRLWAEENYISFIPVKNYSLKEDHDNEKIKGLNIDVLIVTGWQRLLPKWLIDQCKFGVIGLHGSPWGITKGRGRSPQNWALIMGEEKFDLSAFLIQSGADDGPILATETYYLNPWDDIVSSYAKVGWLYAHMIIEVLPKLLEGWCGKPQVGEPEYLPQRFSEDGQIDWRLSSGEIHRLIRGLSKPYPGAWTRIGDKVIYIWQAQPLEELPGLLVNPSEIIAVYPGIPAFMVRTGDGALLVREWTLEHDGNYFINSMHGLVKGKGFESFDGYKQMKKIIKRHIEKNAKQKLSRHLLDWVITLKR